MVKKQNKSKKPESKFKKTVRIIKNVIFVIVMAVLISFMIITLTARINGGTPSLFGHALYRVSSGSMEPFLHVGDIILSKSCDPMELKNGDIITYNGTSGQFAGKRVTHRVVEEPYYNDADGEYYLVTKGDDNPVKDTPIKTSQVTGIFVDKIEFLKWVYDIFVTPWGLLILIALIILAFFNEIVIFIKALIGHDDDEEHEDIQDIIERIQRESAEEQTKEPDNKAEN